MRMIPNEAQKAKMKKDGSIMKYLYGAAGIGKGIAAGGITLMVCSIDRPGNSCGFDPGTGDGWGGNPSRGTSDDLWLCKAEKAGRRLGEGLHGSQRPFRGRGSSGRSRIPGARRHPAGLLRHQQEGSAAGRLSFGTLSEAPRHLSHDLPG